jgi:Bacterial Ig domain/N-acetylmuramoyl-L-alanine amidase
VRTFFRLLTLTALFLGVAFVHLPGAQAIEVPETLADRRPVGAGPVVPPFSIDYLGVLWDTPGRAAEHAHEAAGGHGAVRFRVDGAWTDWQPLNEDGASAAGQWASALVPAGDAEAYQVRGLPVGAGAPRAVALNTTDGRRVEVGRRTVGPTAHAVSNCLSRAEWGADESLRFTSNQESWPPDFQPAQTMSVHHTAGINNDPNPAGTVRAIYRYHAVDRGWGDIGYQYLIDAQGRVYEGRWSGAASTPCAAGGGGRDFAHDSAERLVTGAHTGGWNSGNMGAALLGTFTTTNGAEPTPTAVDALQNLLAEFASRHRLDPKAVVNYVNPANGATKTVTMISGHRDWAATDCPGGRLYEDLPAIRDAVAARMAPADAPPAVSISSPADGATVSGPVTVTAAPTDDKGITRVDFSLDGAATAFASDTSSTGGWSTAWDSTKVANGTHRLTATATDTAGQRASSTVTVTVSNTVAPAPLTLTSVTPSSGKQGTTVKVVLRGSGFVAGSAVGLLNGDGTRPVVSGVRMTSSSSIEATVQVGKNSGPKRDRPWDVVVTNPDGRSALLKGGFTVLR